MGDLVNPSDLKYSKEHEWIKMEGDVAVVGITDYAQRQLKDVVFVELPAVGKHVIQGKTMATAESVKAVSDVFCPISGEVVEVNEDLNDKPELLNQSPYEKGWIAKIKVSNSEELKNLMDSKAYEELIKGLQ